MTPFERTAFEQVVHDLWMDTRIMAVAGPVLIERNEELLREARDNLDAALAKIVKVAA